MERCRVSCGAGSVSVTHEMWRSSQIDVFWGGRKKRDNRMSIFRVRNVVENRFWEGFTFRLRILDGCIRWLCDVLKAIFSSESEGHTKARSPRMPFCRSLYLAREMQSLFRRCCHSDSSLGCKCMQIYIIILFARDTMLRYKINLSIPFYDICFIHFHDP